MHQGIEIIKYLKFLSLFIYKIKICNFLVKLFQTNQDILRHPSKCLDLFYIFPTCLVWPQSSASFHLYLWRVDIGGRHSYPLVCAHPQLHQTAKFQLLVTMYFLYKLSIRLIHCSRIILQQNVWQLRKYKRSDYLAIP